jgi:hypothetical protein
MMNSHRSAIRMITSVRIRIYIRYVEISNVRAIYLQSKLELQRPYRLWNKIVFVYITT